MKTLLALQDRDLELDRLNAELRAVPGKIAEIKSAIEGAKKALENAKKELTALQMIRKQKELDLETQEGAIRKHSADLNAVKTNDAYRALLGEIEKAKQGQSALEDEVLQLMEQIDQVSRSWKEKETGFKASEAGLLKQISDWEAKQKELEQTLAGKQAERQAAFDALPTNMSAPYDRIRKVKRGAAIVPIHSEQCSGCHMRVSQSLINEVRRGQKLIACESCSRIVYLEEVLAA